MEKFTKLLRERMMTLNTGAWALIGNLELAGVDAVATLTSWMGVGEQVGAAILAALSATTIAIQEQMKKKNEE